MEQLYWPMGSSYLILTSAFSLFLFPLLQNIHSHIWPNNLRHSTQLVRLLQGEEELMKKRRKRKRRQWGEVNHRSNLLREERLSILISLYSFT
jgi:hypothetical protein